MARARAVVYHRDPVRSLRASIRGDQNRIRRYRRELAWYIPIASNPNHPACDAFECCVAIVIGSLVRTVRAIERRKRELEWLRRGYARMRAPVRGGKLSRRVSSRGQVGGGGSNG